MDWETSSFYICVYEYNKVVQCNYTLKSCTTCMWMCWQQFFSGFIPTMQFFVEKKHNLTLKTLILFFHCNNMHVLHMQLKFEQKYVLLYKYCNIWNIIFIKVYWYRTSTQSCRGTISQYLDLWRWWNMKVLTIKKICNFPEKITIFIPRTVYIGYGISVFLCWSHNVFE